MHTYSYRSIYPHQQYWQGPGSNALPTLTVQIAVPMRKQDPALLETMARSNATGEKDFPCLYGRSNPFHEWASFGRKTWVFAISFKFCSWEEKGVLQLHRLLSQAMGENICRAVTGIGRIIMWVPVELSIWASGLGSRLGWDLLSVKVLSPINKARSCQRFLPRPQMPTHNPNVSISHTQPTRRGVPRPCGVRERGPGTWEHKSKCSQSWAVKLAHSRQNSPLVCKTAPAMTQSWGRGEWHPHGVWSRRAAVEEASYKRNPSPAFILCPHKNLCPFSLKQKKKKRKKTKEKPTKKERKTQTNKKPQATRKPS